MIKVDELKEPPKKGEFYLVPCKVEYTEEERIGYEYDEQMIWMDLGDILSSYPRFICRITPVINHPHSDRENGQDEMHYHKDNRFDVEGAKIRGFHPISGDESRPVSGFNIEYIRLKCLGTKQKGITHSNLVKNTKLKHKCIYKGKCPHRGYDLSQEVTEDGIITCPLHGLRFDSETKMLIENE